MPTKRTRRPGAMTSRMLLFLAASSSARLGRVDEALGGPDDVAARLFVGLELDEVFLFRILEEIRESLVAVVGLVEAGVPALARLLHHRAPDLLFRAALGGQGLEGTEHQVDRLLAL